MDGKKGKNNMAKCFALTLVLSLLLEFASARQVPSTNDAGVTTTIHEEAAPSAAAGLGDQKNFMTYGGVGGYSGVGSGGLPFGGVGGLGGVAGLGGVGGGVGGGIGTLPDGGSGLGGGNGLGGLGGLGGFGGAGGGVGGGGAGSGVLPYP